MEFIKEFKNALSKELCENIIKQFEADDTKRNGITFSGVNLEIKNTYDICISSNPEKWGDLDSILFENLYSNLNKYFKLTNNYLSGNTTMHNIKTNTMMRDRGFQIQKYIKNEGKYIYHNDFWSFENGEYRILTYLWYLNDVYDGGETEFFGTLKIKPEAGKLLIFPTFITYPHSGLMPTSNDKYVITGWISINPDNDSFEVS
jgi:hypothetical protein